MGLFGQGEINLGDPQIAQQSNQNTQSNVNWFPQIGGKSVSVFESNLNVSKINDQILKL